MKKYRVLNPLLSVRKSKIRSSPDYEQFVSWQRGDVMTTWPKHTDIEGWRAAGHIEEVSDGED
jgi:hypothetical protein